MLDSLANKIIGYYPDKFADLKQQLQNELGSYTPQNASAHYQLALEKILASDAYFDDGFFHLHRHRLLLQRPDSEQAVRLSQHDYEELRMEMSDLARSDNYWDILSYRDRWLVNRELFETGGCDPVVAFKGKSTDEFTDEFTKEFADGCAEQLYILGKI